MPEIVFNGTASFGGAEDDDPVINGGGLVQDANDATWVEHVITVVGHIPEPDGQDDFHVTKAIGWDFDPLTELPAVGLVSAAYLTIDVRYSIIESEIDLGLPGTDQDHEFIFSLASDTFGSQDSAMDWDVPDEMAVGGPHDLTLTQDLIATGRPYIYEGIRTGIYPAGSGNPAIVVWEWAAKHGVTPFNSTGSQFRIRVHELHWTLEVGKGKLKVLTSAGWKDFARNNAPGEGSVQTSSGFQLAEGKLSVQTSAGWKKA